MDKLRSIDYFVKVAEKKSIVAAARLLDVTPSGVSKVINSLERELGFPLFHRSTRKISLTIDGGLYLGHCRRILQEIEAAESEVRHQRRMPTGTIKVALHPAFRIPFFARIGAFLQQHRHIRLETKIANSPAILFDEGFDVLIRIGELSDSNLVARSVGWLEQIVVASPSYLADNGDPTDPIDLAHHRWVFPARIDDVQAHSPHLEFTRDGRRITVTASTCVVALDNIGLPESVVGGAGIACLSSIAFLYAFNAGLVKRILSDWSVKARPVYAVFPNARAITPKTVAIVELISELVAEAERVFPSRSAPLPKNNSAPVYQTSQEGRPKLNARSVASG